MNLQETFAKYEGSDEFLKFDRVQSKLSNRPDIHAFILLDRLVPRTLDMVCSAEHDQIWLDVRPEELEKVATEEEVVELIRCGVVLDSEYDSLSMFV